jgi:hypothetical protein
MRPKPRRSARPLVAVLVAGMAFVLLTATAGATHDQSVPVQLVRVSVPTQADRDRLTNLGLDLTEHGEPAFVEAVLHTADEAARLAGNAEGAAAAARTLVGALREHWRVEAAWEPGPESPGVRALEVLDTDAGVWLVIPDGRSVELWPSTPTMVFRLLTGLLPRDHELA